MKNTPLTRHHLADRALLVATVGGVGLLPKAPGTWGSLVGLVLAGAVGALWDWAPLVFAGGAFGAGLWAAAALERFGHDRPEIVIDEVAGQALPVAALYLMNGPSVAGFVVAFAAFRLFDVLKPFPISWLDAHDKGPFGVMADDVAAGAAAAAVVIVAMVADFV
jgi:phosphatidylglycerophosphatase A